MKRPRGLLTKILVEAIGYLFTPGGYPCELQGVDSIRAV